MKSRTPGFWRTVVSSDYKLEAYTTLGADGFVDRPFFVAAVAMEPDN